MFLKTGRVQQKLLVRLSSRRSSPLLNLKRLSFFTFVVVLLSTCRLFLIRKSQIYIPNEHSMFNQSEIDELSNDTVITIGGLRLPRNQCSTKMLEKLPRYAEEFCSNHTVNCSNLTCLDILTGYDAKTYDPILKLISRPIVSEEVYINLTKDCDEYKREAGYILSPANEESKNFSIAFNILIHNKVGQFELLLKTLYRPQNFYCIHIDTKASNNFKVALESITKCFDNVFLSSKAESVRWAGYSRLQADINCMADHLSRNNKWKYLINTAGLAFPIRTNEEMVRILKIYNGSNDIEGIYGARVLRSRFENEWIETNNGLNKTGRKNPKPPHNIDIVRGSAYGIFSREFVRFIVSDKKAIDLLQWAQTTWSPDEFYWATLHHTYSNPHLETPGGFSGYPSEKKWLAVYANWGETPCNGRFVRGVCVSGMKDIQSLVARKEFFVNKFYDDFQPLALSCLYAWIRYKETCHVPFDDTFYKNLKFVKKYR